MEYKTLADPAGHAREILVACLGEVASKGFNRVGSAAYSTLSEEDLLGEAKKLVVKRMNKLVNRLKLNAMVQGGDEPIRSFETRLKPVARRGRFKDKCKQDRDFTNQMVIDNVIMCRLGDKEEGASHAGD
jgi:hypothetical protein